jgi:hypothetical protein
MWHDVRVLCRRTLPSFPGAVNNERKDCGTGSTLLDVPEWGLAGQRHSGMHDGKTVGTLFDARLVNGQGGFLKHSLESVRVRTTDRLTVMPPKPCDINELSILVEQRCERVWVSGIPSVDEQKRYLIGLSRDRVLLST